MNENLKNKIDELIDLYENPPKDYDLKVLEEDKEFWRGVDLAFEQFIRKLKELKQFIILEEKNEKDI
jgi:phosphate uptake regulator